MSDTKFLVVVFDALRPEFVTADLMPNLHAFQARGVRYSNSRSIFPTETRVNQTAVVTGCTPGRNGIVANYFLARDVWPDRLLNTGLEDQLSAAFNVCEGGLIQVPTLGERLAAAGKTYASLSAGTAGGGRLINHSAEQFGTFRVAMRAPGASQPSGVWERLISRCGPLPDYQRPAIDWISWAVNGYLEYVLPEVAPDVMLLWLCEPDETFHYHGIGSPESLQTMRHVDAQFGRILEKLQKPVDDGEMQIIAMSDHGQITLTGEPVDIVGNLCAAGFRAASDVAEDVDCIVHVHNGGGIWVKDQNPDLVAALVEHLTKQPWCGPVFTRGEVCGTLGLEAVGLDHPRAPDISVTCATSDHSNPFGCAGSTSHDAPYPPGGGCHGGLSKYELCNFLSIGGRLFRRQTVIDCPASNIDITPTVLSALGIAYSVDEFDGRPLNEAFAGGEQPESPVQIELRSKNSSGQLTSLACSEYRTVRYLDSARLLA